MKRCVVVDHRSGRPVHPPRGFELFHWIRYGRTERGWVVQILPTCTQITDNLRHVAYEGVITFGVDHRGFFLDFRPNNTTYHLWPPGGKRCR